MRDVLVPGVAQIGRVVQEGITHEAAKKAAKEQARRARKSAEVAEKARQLQEGKKDK